jgi:putative PIN family toxin of toxin-antitoxin system
MKLVLDTDVVVSALRSNKGASAELLRLAGDRVFAIAISIPLVIEYEAKAMDKEHRLAGGLSEADALAVVDELVRIGERTECHFSYRPSVRDPDDEMVLETAINAGADAIVTFNRKDYGAIPIRFGIGCWTPAETLEKLR